MTEGVLFGIGFILFVITTTATLLFGYLQFNRVYREDRERAGQADQAVVTEENGTEILRSPRTGFAPFAFEAR